MDGQFIDRSPSPLNEYFRDFSIILLGIKGLGLSVRFSRKRLTSKESAPCTLQFVLVSLPHADRDSESKDDGQALGRVVSILNSLRIRYSYGINT